MTSASQGGQIRVPNALLQGLPGDEDLPTFIASTEGLTRDAARREVDQLALLQSIAPIFRVVLMTESDAFQDVRALGWPVEHLPPQEVAHSLTPRAAAEQYRLRRLRIAGRNYAKAIVVEPRIGSCLADRVAHSLAAPSVAALIHGWTRKLSVGDFQSGVLTLHNLLNREEFTIAGHGGAATIRTLQQGSSGLLILAGSSVGGPPPFPADTHVIQITFTDAATIRYEGHIYRLIISQLEPRVAVVEPFRIGAATQRLTRDWIDLIVEQDSEGWDTGVDPNTNYSLLKGDSRVEWGAATRYATVRRLARWISRR